MEGSNDLPLPFGASLYRKASHTTYGRRGRAPASVKEGSKTDDATRSKRAGKDRARMDQEKAQPLVEQGSEGEIVDISKEGRVRTHRQGIDGSKGVERQDATHSAAMARSAEPVESAGRSPRVIKRRRLDAGNQGLMVSPLSSATRKAQSPSSELSELPSDLSDLEAATTPKAPRPGPVSVKTIHDEPMTTETPKAPKQEPQTAGKRDHGSRTEAPPKTTTFLPAINPSPNTVPGMSQNPFPSRRKARMLTRAESFGRTEAQKDQKELAQAESVTTIASTNAMESLSLPFLNSPTTAPVSPRRMFARSNTLATANLSPSSGSRQPLSRTTSMPTSPAKLPSGVGGTGTDFEKGGVPPNAGPVVKRTYGRARVLEYQRSNDSQLPVEEKRRSGEPPSETQSTFGEDISDISPARHPLEQRESYADLVKRLEMDDDETLEWEETADPTDFVPNAISLAELRSRGENRKFMDDLAWLLDGLRDDSLSVRRSSVIDLLSKMSAPGWFEKLTICGQVEDICSRLLRARDTLTDLGFDLALLEYLTYVARAAKLKSILSNHLDDVVAFLLHVLASPSITFEFTVNNAKRKVSPALQTLDKLRLSLGLIDADDKPLSVSAMAANVISAALHLCISGHIDPPTPVMLSNICSVVVNETQRKLSILPERIDLYEKGLDLFADGTSADVAFLSDVIDILSATSTAWLEVRGQLETEHCGLATDLANLLLITDFDRESMQGLKDDQGKFIVDRVRITANTASAVLRLLVTPTLASREWSKAILRSIAPGTLVLRLLVTAGVNANADDSRRVQQGEQGSTDAIEDGSESERDVSLPLGLLYNLTDAADDVGRNVLLRTELSGQCTRGKKCIKQCRCLGRKSAIWHLCDLFNKQLDQRNDNPSAAFLAGYLTLLFSKCLEDSTCKEQILLHVAGSGIEKKIGTMRDCLQQFAEVYNSAQSRLQQIMPSEEEESNSAEREDITSTIGKGLEILDHILD